MQPLVTIGIPCYNAAQWIAASVQSALDQTWPNKEVIVVDDGSTDNSSEVLQSFGAKIRHVRTENRGVNHARNEILRMARGEWVQYLDADDYLLPEKISCQLSEASGDVIYSPVLIERWQNGVAEPLAVESINLQRDLYSQWLTWEMPQTGGCLWKRALLQELGGWDEQEKVCDEHELYFRAMQHGAKFVHAPTPGAVYRLWSTDSRCHRDGRIVVGSKTALIDKFIGWMKERHLWTQAHQQLAGRACFEMARTLASMDLGEAATYHRAYKQRGLIHLDGPAAPGSYRMAYRLFGFKGAEQLARVLR